MLKAAVCFLISSWVFSFAAADCPPVPVRDFSEIACTDETHPESRCEVVCDSGFQLVLQNDVSLEEIIVCEGDAWDKPFPYCQPSCPPNAKADVVFLVDRSGSMARANTRALMREFMVDMISQWTISSDNVNVAVVPYNEEPTYGYVINFNEFSDDKNGLLEAMKNMPSNTPGSLTGEALKYTISNILLPENGNRRDAPDIVIVMTDGREQDHTEGPIQQLIEAGVTTYGIGFYPRRHMDLLTDHLITISGNDSSRVHVTEKRNLGYLGPLKEHLKGIYCFPVTCDRNSLSPPENGAMECSGDNEVGSECYFSCNEGYVLSGDRSSTCLPTVNAAAYTTANSVCTPVECEPEITSLSNGEMTCSNGNVYESMCEFQCTTPGYYLYPTNRTEINCLSSGKWDEEPPCCARPCPPYASTDVIMILDSSSSIGDENWNIVKSFVRRTFENFAVDPTWTNFGVLRYTRTVDTRSQIMMRDYPNDREGMLRALRRIPYRGWGTNTGQAIQYVVDNLLTQEAGNRPGAEDVVILVTDGKASDDVYGPADQLHAMNATVYVLAIPPDDQSLDMDQLMHVAGSESNLFLLDGFDDLLGQFFATKIYSKVCGDPCSQ